MTHVYRCRYLSIFAPRFLGVALYEEPVELDVVVSYDSNDVRASHELRLLVHYVMQHMQVARDFSEPPSGPVTLSISTLSALLQADHYCALSEWICECTDITLHSLVDSFWLILR